MNKKGQLEIQETILVIFIFIIILAIGLTVFYRYTTDSIKADAQVYEEFRFKVGISSIPSMSEVKCSFLSEQKECMDLEKVKAFSIYSKDYFSLFGYSNITLYMVYPGSTQKPVVLYYRKPASTRQSFIISTPVLVYDPEYSNYNIGKLTLVRYK